MNLIHWSYPSNFTFLWLNLKVYLDEISNKCDEKIFYLLANIIFHYFCTSIPPYSHPYSNPNQTKNKTKEYSAKIVLEDISGWKLQQTK